MEEKKETESMFRKQINKQWKINYQNLGFDPEIMKILKTLESLICSWVYSCENQGQEKRKD